MVAAEATSMGTAKTSQRFVSYLAASLGVGLLSLLAGVLSGPELSTPILFGAGAATFAGVIAFPALHAGLPRGTNGLLAGFTVGMLVRMLLVGVGLVASGLRGGAAIVFAFSFFFVYAGTMAVEIAYVIAVSRDRAGAASPPQAAVLERSRP